MTAEPETISWTFGGPLAGQPANVAWSVLGGAALVGLIFVWWSYHRSLIAVPPGKRIGLCLLRSGLWLALLVVLVAPTRIHRTYDEPVQRPLAVLVDRSASMTSPDNRQRRRLDDALRRWREMEPVARGTFGELKTFAFADGMEPVATPGSAVKVAVDQTRFFTSLERVLAEAPPGGWGGIVTLTDGLDTSGVGATAGAETVSRAATAGNTPLFFVPGRNRYAGAPFFGLRQFEVPAQTAPRTTFRVAATLESFQSAARTVEVQFKVNGAIRPSEPLRIEAGRRLTAWSAEITADAPGVLDVELRIGDELARAAVRVELPPSNRILYFQGALDWSYRFLADILKRDASFVLTPVFNFPNPKAVLPPGALARMPATREELAGFEIVILANAAANQFTAAQQEALSAWVRDGGILLFFTPDDDSTQGFAGSELEKMLPVVFDAPTAARKAGGQATRVLAQLRGGYGAADTTKLLAFTWEDSPRVKEIFAEAERTKNTPLVAPLFSEFAHVARAKPGADVLARHPSATAPGGERAILLATQRYGRGQSAVLTTDALWRWKLNQPTSERGAETFWQNLFAWMMRGREFGLRFDQVPRIAAVEQEIAVRVAGASAGPLRLEAASGATRVALSESAAEDGARIVRWRPPTEGFWEILARDAGGREAKHWIAVKPPARTGELSGAAPDEELLRSLANRTGGAILENTPPPGWQGARPAGGALIAERREPLWHQPWLFGAMLGAYCVEMLLRRKWKML